MRNRALITAVLLASSCAAIAQTQGTYQPPQVRPAAVDDPSRDDVWSANMGNEPVGVGDLLYASVAGSPELSRSYRVDDSGSIAVPLMNEKIHVEGLTAEKISEVIASDLRSEHLLVAPIVSVAVLDYRSRQVTVMGAVRVPGVFQAIGHFTVMDAIAKAQGLNPDAGPLVVITRPANGSGQPQVIKTLYTDLVSGSNSAANIEVHGGDQIDVPEAPKVYVVGNVKMPGSYPLNDSGGITVLKALAMSQGQQSFSTKDAYIYRNIDGTRHEIEVPLRNILHRKSPDMALMPNDILYVPEATGMHATATVLQGLTGIGASAGTELAIWH
jgi:polysaccharide biosynthesis/export protein